MTPLCSLTLGAVGLLLAAGGPLRGAAAEVPSGPVAPAKARWDQLLRMGTADLASAKARSYATNILSHQTPRGDWPKNLDTFAAPAAASRETTEGTWDNQATVREVRWLARYRASTGDARAGDAVRQALRHVLGAQYAIGGWPQRHPPGDGYHRHITSHDGTFVHLLRLLDAAATGPDFGWLEDSLRSPCRDARERGLACVLRCQVRLAGRATIWGAQHDATTLEPAAARRFEPASLATAESAGVLNYLMDLPHPSAGVIAAIESGVQWFSDHGLDGIRVVQDPDGDRRVEAAPGSPRVWARFYDLQEERPLFCGRDGNPVRRLADIERERRSGYAWYGTWGADVQRAYTLWKARRK